MAFVINKTPYTYNFLGGKVVVKAKASSAPVTKDIVKELENDKYFAELQRAKQMEIVDAIPEELKTPTQKLNEAAETIAALEAQLAGGDADLAKKYKVLEEDHKELLNTLETLKKEAEETIASLRTRVAELEAQLES